VVGSITHCPDYRAAAVAMQLDVLTIGIDAEIHEELPNGVSDQVLLDEEQAWLRQGPGGVHWDRLVFSAKESVYKAWFPLTGLWLGFEDIVVTFEPAEGTFHARLLVAPPRVGGGDLSGFTGHFLVRDGLAVTAVALLRKSSPGKHCRYQLHRGQSDETNRDFCENGVAD
jgi:4'-phosphopantetheinyl transferase EntD